MNQLLLTASICYILTSGTQGAVNVTTEISGAEPNASANVDVPLSTQGSTIETTDDGKVIIANSTTAGILQDVTTVLQENADSRTTSTPTTTTTEESRDVTTTEEIAKLSVGEASPTSDHTHPDQKPAVLRFLQSLWKIVLSPFTLFFASLDYSTKLGERSGAFLNKWLQAHSGTPSTAAPFTETNEIPPLVKNIPPPEKLDKKDNIFQRLHAWIQSKPWRFKKLPSNGSIAATSNSTDWQYPSDLSDESGQQDTNGLNWFFSPRKLNINEASKGREGIEETTPNSVTWRNVTARRRLSVMDSLRMLRARGRLVYDWVLWKLFAKQKDLPTFSGKDNSFGSRFLRGQPSNPGLRYDPWSNSTSPYACDDEPSPVCAIDATLGYTIFLNQCKMHLFNFDHLSNFTVYPTDVCLGLFIKYPNKFFQSKKQ